MNALRKTPLFLVTAAVLLQSFPMTPRAAAPAGSDAAGSAEAARFKSPAAAPIRLKSRQFMPPPGLDPSFASVSSLGGQPRHGVIQLHRLPSATERSALRSAGVELLGYLPDKAYLARLPADLLPVLALAPVRWVGPLQAADKAQARLLQQGANADARNADGSLRLTVRFFEDVAPDEASALATARGGRIVETLPAFHQLRADFPADALPKLLAEDTVQWVEDVTEPRPLNDGAVLALGAQSTLAAPYGLNGAGSVIGEWDGGRATDLANVPYHTDLLGRVTAGDTTPGFYDYHATHVAGTAIGSGAGSANQGGSPLQWKGVAPGARIVGYEWTSFLAEYAPAITTYQIDLSTNSWMNGGNGLYTSDSSSLDQIITGSQGKRIPILWAAGNQRNLGAGGHACDMDLDQNPLTNFDAYDCIANLAAAKNTIAVGASNSNDKSMTAFSSWGPTNDGRLKPDLIAPGCQSNGDMSVTSTVPTNMYGGSCGTSMSTPAAAGALAVLLQRYRQLCPASGQPQPATLKAMMIHTATDMDDATAWYNRGPDYASGYGHIDLPKAVDMLPFHRQNTVQNQGVKNYPITVTQQQNLKVTLVWDDVAAAPNAATALVNDLDLELVDPIGGIHRPWVLNPLSPQLDATRGIDNRNVVEQVVVDNVPLNLAGTWTIRVKGTNVTTANQRFTVVSELLQTSSCAGPTPSADLWAQDTPSDSGAQPNIVSPWMWTSDDIRVRLTAVDGPHTNPEFGQTNYIFGTVRNRGAATGPYAQVFFYWANASTGLAWPTDWNLIGSMPATNVPAGGAVSVGPLPWNPPGIGHYCLYARIVNFSEPIGLETNDVNLNTKNWNQIVWHNVNIVNLVVTDPYQNPFKVRNPTLQPGVFDLLLREPEQRRRDPFTAHGEVFVDLGAQLYDVWKRSGAKQQGLQYVSGSTFKVIDSATAELVGLSLREREQFDATIKFVPRDVKLGASYRFDVIQQHRTGSKDRGGVSYQLRATEAARR